MQKYDIFPESYSNASAYNSTSAIECVNNFPFGFILCSVPDGKKVNPGSVEAIAEQPGNPQNILIGYRRGLMILWNKQSSTSIQVRVWYSYIIFLSFMGTAQISRA